MAYRLEPNDPERQAMAEAHASNCKMINYVTLTLISMNMISLGILIAFALCGCLTEVEQDIFTIYVSITFLLLAVAFGTTSILLLKRL